MGSAFPPALQFPLPWAVPAALHSMFSTENGLYTSVLSLGGPFLLHFLHLHGTPGAFRTLLLCSQFMFPVHFPLTIPMSPAGFSTVPPLITELINSVTSALSSLSSRLWVHTCSCICVGNMCCLINSTQAIFYYRWS